MAYAMSQSSRKFILILLVLVLCCLGVILNCVAFGTQYWTIFHGSFQQNNNSVQINLTVDINAGLFRGELAKCCLPTVNNYFSLKDEYTYNNDFMSFGLWVATLLFLALGVTFGCIGAIFAGVNSVITPIEMITGVIGLYLWNGLACLFSLICLLLAVGQYSSHFRHIAKSLSGHYNISVEMEDTAFLGYSFYLVVVATIIYLFNNLLVYLSTRRSWERGKPPIDADEEPTNGVIMLY